MDVAFVSGALQVVCAVVNNVMGKQPKEEATLRRQMELAKELEEAKMRCRKLELELADVTNKLEKESEIAKNKRLKFAVEQLQLQIRWQRLERLHRSPFGRIRHWIEMQNLLGIASLFIFLFALCACVYSTLPIVYNVWSD
ncbi:hypothetical protein THRCLA_21369 [Thraustotheca clavata]|uniref:Uncharacterized protein n=1 Tax=Thraustotheca clavata TaxID=74557 RepID=A0A1V9ZX86_9STRA|nr:hypothetical protein THRCLA_21369 [Thraustotheca clavata]